MYTAYPNCIIYIHSCSQYSVSSYGCKFWGRALLCCTSIQWKIRWTQLFQIHRQPGLLYAQPRLRWPRSTKIGSTLEHIEEELQLTELINIIAVSGNIWSCLNGNFSFFRWLFQTQSGPVLVRGDLPRLSITEKPAQCVTIVTEARRTVGRCSRGWGVITPKCPASGVQALTFNVRSAQRVGELCHRESFLVSLCSPFFKTTDINVSSDLSPRTSNKTETEKRV